LAAVSVTLRKISDAIVMLKAVTDLKGEIGTIQNDLALLRKNLQKNLN
jgi:hypothetical protein